MKQNRLPIYILGAMVAGIVVGAAVHYAYSPDTAAAIGGYLSILSDIFLRLIKMIIAPLVFATLVGGIAGMGDGNAVGRVGLKAMGWFITASIVSLLLGLVMANLTLPGKGMNLPLPAADVATNLKTSALNVRDFVVHVFPKSIVEAMATNEILQSCRSLCSRCSSVLRSVALKTVSGNHCCTLWKDSARSCSS